MCPAAGKPARSPGLRPRRCQSGGVFGTFPPGALCLPPHLSLARPGETGGGGNRSEPCPGRPSTLGAQGSGPRGWLGLSGLQKAPGPAQSSKLAVSTHCFTGLLCCRASGHLAARVSPRMQVTALLSRAWPVLPPLRPVPESGWVSSTESFPCWGHSARWPGGGQACYRHRVVRTPGFPAPVGLGPLRPSPPQHLWKEGQRSVCPSRVPAVTPQASLHLMQCLQQR